MKIVIEKSSGLVIYFFSDSANVEITETAMRGDITAMDIKASRHELLTGVEPPVYLQQGGVLSYQSGVWAIANAEAYAEHEQYILDRAHEQVMQLSVPMKSARKALILAGIPMATINAAFDAIPDATQKELAKVDWEFSSVVRRDSPLVASMASALGLSSAEVDGLFVAAAAIPD